MALSKEQLKKYLERVISSKIRILNDHGFFGLLLMNMRYAVDENVETAYTDGTKIVFGTTFLDEISDSELDFIMMHEIMHIILKHCFRGKDYDNEQFNIACDIVVNSNILLENKMNLNSITITKYGESMHLAPNNKEGYLYTAEEVYDMLKGAKNNININGNGNGSGTIDSHSSWGGKDGDLEDEWNQKMMSAAETISIRQASTSRGTIPGFAKRIIEKLKRPQIDWRTILNNFIQEEINDYSFFPPDHRYDDSPFFLPDFNEKDESISNILFMVDTSGSMNDASITQAYSEINSAIEQFNGRFSAMLGFFDAKVVPPIPFSNENELNVIAPYGGGGTSFDVIFEYVHKKMIENLPSMIIILTDGYAPFPEEKVALGIPVLWLITNNNIMPPWGKVARLIIKDRF